MRSAKQSQPLPASAAIRLSRALLLPALLALGLGLSGLAAPGRARDALMTRPVALGSQANVALEATIFVERERVVRGNLVHTLEPAKQLSRGDRVVTLLSWYRLGGTGGFTVANALPSTLRWQSDDQGSDAMNLSVDGGRHWGALSDLSIGNRPATAQDVTHMRWHIAPEQAMRGSGRIVYAGIVK